MVFHAGNYSLPSDFGAWHVVKHIREQYALPTKRVVILENWSALTLSGSSYFQGHSFGGESTQGWDPFLLGGIRKGGLRPEDTDPNVPVQLPHCGMWSIQGVVSDRVTIRASSGLLESTEPYGDNFHVSNWVPFPDQRAANGAMMMTAFLAPKSLDKLVEQHKIPAKGEGPGERMRQEVF